MAEETENTEPQEAPPPAKRKKIVLIGAVVGSILAGAAVGVLVAGPVVAKRAGFVASAATDSNATHADSASGEHGEGGEAGAAATVHLIDNLVLNPAGSGGTRFLMLAAAIEAKDNAVIESLKARDAEVRDAVLRVMGSKTVEQLSDMTSRDSLKVELAAALGAMLPKDAIKRIYFPQFVIQ